MNLLGAKLYDPTSAVSKSTASLLAMTAFDTTNLRLTVTVPAHGFLQIRMRCNLSGATTMAQVLLGVLEGSTVRGRVVAQGSLPGTAVATTNVSLVADFVIPGLTPGSITLDAAYGVETVVASTNIHYGGPNNTSANDAWGAFVFEIWDPQPLKTGLDGGVNVTQFGGTAGTFAGGRPEVNTTHVAGTSQTAGDIIGDTNDIQARLPAALTAGGNMKSDMLALNGGTQSAADLKDFADDGYDPATNKVQGVVLTDTVTTYTGNTVQTGDSFARLGAPAGASVSADIAAVKSQTAAIETDTAEIGVAGAGLTAINLPDQTMNITGDITGNLSGSVGSVIGAVGSVTGNIGGNIVGNVNGNVVGSVGSVTAAVTVGTNNDKTGYALSAAGVDAVLDDIIEGTHTLRAILRGYNAALLSKASGLATTTAIFRDIDDTKDRITATVDADGNRTAITLDLA